MRSLSLIKALSAFLAFSASFNAGAQFTDHLDMTAPVRGAETTRTETVYFDSAADALRGDFAASPFYLDLDGEWDFLYFDSDALIPSDLGKVSWNRIKVPGNWEVQGWGVPVYTNILYDFCPEDPQPPALPKDIPVGIYRRSFTVPAAWKGREVYLNICGAKSGVYTFINGRNVSYTEDSKDLARIRITPWLREGENELVCRMYRWSTGSYLEDQDFWRMSGFERDVYLSSEKKHATLDFEVVSTLADDLDTGLLRVSARKAGEETPEAKLSVLDADGKVLARGTFGSSPFELSIPGVRRWSAEDPQLYALLIEYDGEYTRFDLGFRRVEIKGGVLYFNGRPIKFKGVNLHEHNEFTGHYTDREYIRKSLLLMKENNVNAIRTCHYPQPRAFYELCDSLGFYVMDEANIESHGMHYGEKSLAKQPEWYPKHEERTLNMYYRTRNYPCVTVFSLGNEAGFGQNFARTYELLKKLERGGMERPVAYERTGGGYGSDVHDPMYPSLASLRYEVEHEHRFLKKPYFACEYSHAMGNSNGSFDLMWDYMYRFDFMQGGFIWDWIDQGLAVADPKGVKYWTYGGDYGDPEKDPAGWFADRNFCCNGLVNPDLDPHPGLAEVKHWYQNVWVKEVEAASGSFRVVNRDYFRSLSAYELRWELQKDGIVVKSGTVGGLSAGPQDSQPFTVNLPALETGKTYYLNFRTLNAGAVKALPAGFELASDQIHLQQGEWKFAVKGKPAAPRLVYQKKGGKTIAVIKGGASKLVVDTSTGKLVSFVSRGKTVIDGSFGLEPNFWRAPIDNDWGNKYPVRGAAWKDAPVFRNAVAVEDTVRSEAGVTVFYDLPGGCSMVVEYLLCASGDLRVKADFKGSSEEAPIEVPRIGFRTRLKASADSFRYFGRGPLENYWDRNTAAFVGLYEGSATANLYPYVRPQESGHRTDCEWLEIGPLRVCGAPLFEFNALRCTVEDLDPRNADGSRIYGHVNDNRVRPYVELCIDYRMTGVGGYDSWRSKPEPGRTLFSDRDYRFEFTMGAR